MFKKAKKRNEKGFIVIAAYLGFLFLLPLGLFAFEVLRIQLCQQQLRAVTDAAALCGAQYYSTQAPSDQSEQTQITPDSQSAGSSSDSKTNGSLDKAKAQALLCFQRNIAAGYELANAVVSTTVDSDSPNKGISRFDLIYDKSKKMFTAKAALGVEPIFGRFLGLGSVPIHAQSHASISGMDGDVVIVFDLSRSMGFATKSVWVDRKFNESSMRMTYSIKKALNTASSATQTLPAFPNARIDVVPDPEAADFSVSEKLKTLKDAPADIKLAALVEAKAGNLEDNAKYESSNASKSGLSKYISPQEGLQDEFQRIALAATQPLSDAKSALKDFVNEITQSKSVHTSLVSYSSSVSGSKTEKQDILDSFSTRKDFRLPNIELSSTDEKHNKILNAIEPSPCFSETNTGEAIRRAVAMLKGDGHRHAVAKSIVLLTDGRPNPPRGDYFSGLNDAVDAAKEAGENNIRIHAVGFFHTSYSEDELKNGPTALSAIASAAGNGSRSYVAPDVPSLKCILRSIAKSSVSLVNSE